MTSTSARTPGAARFWPARLRSWQSVAALAAIAGGGAALAGCFLPWAQAFAGLIGFPGTDSSNGRVLAVLSGITITAGLCHLIRGRSWSRWTAGLAGFAALAFSALLLLRLTATIRNLGSNDMVILRGGPGLWVVAAGALVAFATLFLPSSAQQAFRVRPEGGGLAARAADPGSAGMRRWLQLGLGAVWILDAALQFQPFMFGGGFVRQVIDPAAMGSPAAIARTVTGSGSVILAHPALFNAGFAAIQLMIGLALLSRRTARAGLAGTLVWGLAVWWLGEAFGGLFSGMASPLTGAPGAALLYVLIAALAWPRRGRLPAGARSAADSGLLGRTRARVLWVTVWGGFAALMFQPRVAAPGALRESIGSLAAGHNLLASADRVVATMLGSGGHVPALVFAALFTVIAAGVFLPSAAARVTMIAAAVLALAIWVIGENFGGLSTGSATDPDTGLLLLLMIAAFWPTRQLAGSADDEVGCLEPPGAAAEADGEAGPEREVLSQPAATCLGQISAC